MAATTKLVQPGASPYAARTMRTSGPVAYDTENFAAGQVINVAKPIPLEAPLAHLIIRVKGRLTVTVNITDSPPEVFANLFSQIKINGKHVALGQIVPIQQSGEITMASSFLLDRGKGDMSWLKVNAVNYTLKTYSTDFGAAFFTVANSPYDFSAYYIIPVYPYGANDFNAMQYLWDARSWQQTLQVQLTCRDITAFGTTGTRTLTAFGSGLGVPQVDLLLDYANLGPSLDASIAKAVVARNVYNITGNIINAGNLVRLQLLQNAKTTNVLIKTGTLQAGSTNVYSALLDSILEGTILRKNQQPIRNLQYNDVTERLYGFRGARSHVPGYLLISADDGEPANNPHASIRADTWSGGTQFDAASQIVGPAATNIGELMQEEILGTPVVAVAA